MIARTTARLRWLFGAPDPREPEEIEVDLADEFEFHLHMLQREEEAAGASPDAARAAAAHRFGDIEQVRRACRRVALRERTMIQRFNTALTVILLVAVTALGVQVVLGHREVASTLAAITERLEALDARAEVAPAQVNTMNTPDATDTIDAPRVVALVEPREPARRAETVPVTEETFDRTINAWIFGDIGSPRAVNANNQRVDFIVWYAAQPNPAMPQVYQPHALITATIRRPRGDGSDEVTVARWTGWSTGRQQRGFDTEGQRLPTIVPADRIEVRVALPSPLPSLRDDWLLTARVDELRGVLKVLASAIDEPGELEHETLNRYRAEHESVRLRLAAMGITDLEAPETRAE